MLDVSRYTFSALATNEFASRNWTGLATCNQARVRKFPFTQAGTACAHRSGPPSPPPMLCCNSVSVSVSIAVAELF